MVGILVAALACACGPGASDPNDGSINLPNRGTAGGDPGGGSAGGGDTQGSGDAPKQDPPPEETTPITTPTPTDPATLCDPKDPASGVKLFDGALATDTKQFGAAAGFPPASWAYQASAYQQLRLVDAGDAALLLGNDAIDSVDVVVRAASTEVSSTITPRLRQMFVLLGAKTANGALTAYGCGAEVVQGLSPEQRTSVVKLSGPPSNVATTAIARTARGVLQANEDFTIHAHLAAGKLSCTITEGTTNTVTSAEASVTGLVGSVGFFTRQTKAAFKTAKICNLHPAAAPN